MFLRNKAFHISLLFALCGYVAQAQDACSITLQNDTTICQGQSVLLQGPDGFPNYSWNTGANTQDITVSSTGAYILAASYPSGELVTNGDFSAGNTGFTTDFTLNSNLNQSDGTYWIGTNAASHHPQFNGTGSGQFMIANSGYPSALFMVWCQEVEVCPEQSYTMTFRARTVSNATPARLQWWMDGVPVGPEWNLPAFGAGWQTITQVWTSPAALTTANICLRVMSGEGIGNDFGLDDISMSGTIVLTDTVNVTVTPLPVVDFGPDQNLCFGETLTLDATVPGGSYLWQDGSTGPTFTVGSAGNYSVTVTANQCSSTESINVAYSGALVVDLGPDTTLCTGETLVLDATLPGGATYLWQNGSTNPTFTVSTAGSYSVTVTRNGCSANASINVSYNPLPVVDLGPDQSICAGQQTTLDATTIGGSYLWQDGSTNATFQADAAATYTVDVSVNGCTGTGSVDIAVIALPVVDLGGDQTVCPGSTVSLDASTPGGSYLWQDGSTNATFSSDQAGSYSVNVTVGFCSTTASVTISHFTLPVVDLGSDQTICAGEAGNFAVAIPNSTYAWSTGATAASIAPTAAGIYWVDVTRDGCTVRDSVALFVTSLPVVDLGPDQSICPGQETTLDATTPGGTYLWQDGSTGATFEAQAAGTYSVEVSVNGCSNSGSVEVSEIVLPLVDLGGDRTVCPGSTVILDATTPSATYLWQDGSTNATFSATQAGTFTVTVNVGSCPVVASVTISNYTLPVVDLGSDQTVCVGGAGNFAVAIPNSTYAWSTGATAASIAPTAAGIYWVDVTRDGCTVRDSVELFLTPLPVVDLGSAPAVCPGATISLDATTPGGSYLWSTGATTASILATPGDYDVEVSVAGCSSTASATVASLPAPTVLLGADTTLCTGDVLVLDVSTAGASYLWNNGETAPTISVGASGSYSVTLTGPNSCTASDTIVVDFVTPLPVDLGPDIIACEGDEIELDATTPGASYLWNTGATTATLSVDASGSYSVTVTQGSCVEIGSIEVSLQAAPVLDLGTQTSLCPGETLLLDATTAGATYLWSNGDTTPTLEVDAAGTYSVEVTNAANCSSEASITILVIEPGLLDLGGQVEICLGATVVLDATLPGATYLWSTGATTASLELSDAGSYWVEVSQSGCSVSDTVLVTVVDPGTVDLGPDTSLCEGESLLLDATLSGASYLWNDGSTLPTFSASTTGSYSLEASVGQCVVTDTIILTFTPLPFVDLGPDVSLCDGSEATFEAGTPGGNYLWNDGSTGPNLTTGAAGTVSVTVSVAGCSASDEAEVELLPNPQPMLGPDTVLCEGATLLLDATDASSSYLWDDGQTTPTRLITQAGTYWVRLERNACQGSDTINVAFFEPSVLDLGDDVTLCPGENASLGTGLVGVPHLWSTGATGNSITASSSGSFWVEVQVAGCAAADTVLVTLVDMIQPELGSDRTICSDEPLVLSVDPGMASVIWTNGSTAASITVMNSGVYGVTLLQDGCSASDEVTIFVQERVSELGLPETLQLCLGTSYLLEIEGLDDASILWSNGSTGQSLLVSEAGVITVEVTGECVDASATVLVVAADCSTSIFVPNAFSPNADGYNDLFAPVLASPADDLRFDVFNRWGELLFSTKEMGIGWDGSYGRMEAQDGVYIWVITYTEFTEMGRTGRRMTGHVTLIR